jgi:MFS family permease
MYVSIRNNPVTRTSRSPRRDRVPRTVVMLGLTSLLTDVSSEMITAILPIYLVLQLGLNPAQFGVVDGLYRGVSALSRLGAGLLSDWLRRPKFVATIGYGLSALTRPLLLTSSAAGVAALVSVDRVGKGIRTAPRDAMIATASRPRSLGYNFGVHRAMDNTGAMLGPLLAFAVLMVAPRRFDAVFVVSTAFAFLGLAVLVLLVPGRSRRPKRSETATCRSQRATGTVAPAQSAASGLPAAGVTETGVTETSADDGCPKWGTALRCRTCGSNALTGSSHRAERLTAADVRAMARSRQFLVRVAVAGMLTLFTVSDAFIFLALLDQHEDLARYFPLLAVGLGLAYSALAVPIGRLADRWGRMRVYLIGHVLLLVAYVMLGTVVSVVPVTIVTILLMGVYYASTDGVLAASVSAALPNVVRASGLSLAQTVVALGGLLSSVAFGLLITWVGAGQAFLLMAAGMALALALAGALLRPRAAASGAAT